MSRSDRLTVTVCLTLSVIALIILALWPGPVIYS